MSCLLVTSPGHLRGLLTKSAGPWLCMSEGSSPREGQWYPDCLGTSMSSTGRGAKNI